MPLKSVIKKLGLFLLWLNISFLFVACDSNPYCDEKIDDTNEVQFSVMSDGFIERISRELHLLHVFVDGCYKDGKTEVRLRYLLPASYSEYGFDYVDTLAISSFQQKSSRAGSFELIDRYNHEVLPLDYEMVIQRFKGRVKNIESSPEIQEFYAHIKVDTTQSPIYIDNTGDNSVVIYSADHKNWIAYNLFNSKVAGYILPNSRIWVEFPEIQQAHKIVDETLLGWGSRECFIDKDSGITRASLSSDLNKFDISLVCEKGVLKTAHLVLKSDGSYQDLTLTNP